MSKGEPTSPSSGAGAKTPSNSATTPCPFIKGTPVDIPPNSNSIVCKSGKLVVQSNNTGPDKACTQAHEEQHMKDWKGRYGENLCNGVPDGQLPVGGDGYDEFLRQSECKAYKVGKSCREKALKSAADADKPAIQSGINRDNAQLRSNSCG